MKSFSSYRKFAEKRYRDTPTSYPPEWRHEICNNEQWKERDIQSANIYRKMYNIGEFSSDFKKRKRAGRIAFYVRYLDKHVVPRIREYMKTV